MNRERLEELLKSVQAGSIGIEEAIVEITYSPFDNEEIAEATLDHNRKLRLGLGEVIYGEGKTVEQIINIAERFAVEDDPVLISRLNDEKLDRLEKEFPEGRTNRISMSFTINPLPLKEDQLGEPAVAIVTAGTSDSFVAEEAIDVCGAMGVAFTRVVDVGVSGIHRILTKIEILQKSSVVIVIAGMEGALPSVIGGLTDRPVIAVPTDVGYGANFQGLSALLGMLNSCAPGLTVTNINGGFSAAFAACRIVKRIEQAEKNRLA